MRNFYKISHNADVTQLMLQLKANPHLWDENTARTNHEASPHREASDIILRFNDLSKHDKLEGIASDNESIWHPASSVLTSANQIIFPLMSIMHGERLGRCLITRLPPGGRIYPHSDDDLHADYYERIHVVLNGLPGSIFECGEERVCMRTGEVWWFNNKERHEVINNSEEDRIHLIVDVRVKK